MEIYNTIGEILIGVVLASFLVIRDIKWILDPRPILALVWGIFLIWRF